MKNKNNKKHKLNLRSIFSKEQMLIIKKYPRLSIYYDIPYPVINRAYDRYLKNVDEYISFNNYPKHWFSKDITTFCLALKWYIVAKKANHLPFKFGTHGYTKMEIVKLSGLDEWIYDNIKLEEF